MDIYELTQIMIVITTGLVFGRLGLALARRIERRPAEVADTADSDRLHAVEDECAQLRREVAELHERQDFTERLLGRGGSGESRPPAREPRITTPH